MLYVTFVSVPKGGRGENQLGASLILWRLSYGLCSVMPADLKPMLYCESPNLAFYSFFSANTVLIFAFRQPLIRYALLG